MGHVVVKKGFIYKVAILIFIVVIVLAVTNLKVQNNNNHDEDAVQKPLTIAMSISSLHSNYMVSLVNGAEMEAKRHNNVRLLIVNANFDAATQLSQMENLITQKPDAIILNALDSDGIVPAIVRANAEGIPIFTLDLGANGGNVQSFWETDNEGVGREAAKFIAEKLRVRYGDYLGNVVDLMGSSGMTSTKSREKGFAEQMAEHPGIKIIASQITDLDQEQSLNIMTNILQGQSHIDAVFCANDSVTVGASRAIMQTGRFYPIEDERHIIICGVDGTGPALEEIRRGKIDGTVSQNPIKMAAKAIANVVDFLRTGKGVEKHSYYPYMLITKENIDSVEVQNYGLWSEVISK